MKRVGVIGGLGKMGQEAINAISNADGMSVGAVIDVFKQGEKVNIAGENYLIESSLEEVADRVDLFLDLTGPNSVKKDIETALSLGKNIVVGATGLSQCDIEAFRKESENINVNVMIIPNFAIGAVLMMEVSKKIAKYMNEVEIIEYHHPNKLDAPSGTAIKTAELIKGIKEARGEVKGSDILDGARGAVVGDINVHSIRLNGYVASQEVIFGGLGQTLAIRHDSINRESFMPGVIMCINKIEKLRGLTYGLENLL